MPLYCSAAVRGHIAGDYASSARVAESRNALFPGHIPAGKDDGRFSICYLANHTLEFDRADGTLRISGSGGQTFLSAEENRELLGMLDSLSQFLRNVNTAGRRLNIITPTGSKTSVRQRL